MSTNGEAYNLASDLGAVFEFQDGSTQQHVGVSLATLLQCLCIAEQCHLVPPLDPEWEAHSLPAVLRDASQHIAREREKT